ncbi:MULTISPECIES: hypothetical protein [unclassified Bradyrhizobium]|uniref:hypothetical protein n=1 Tax=unclassified Bradyrhizobium TaxID=2631580 RepID=UPI0033984802
MQILVPTETGKGEPVSKEWFDNFLQELTDKSARRRVSSARLDKACGEAVTTERDTIAVVEVMAAKLAPEFWRFLRERLQRELSQEEIVIRAQEIIPL